MIIIKNLTVSYDGQEEVLTDLSLHLDRPGIVGIIGPNGAGKSSLIKALIGLVPYQGQVTVAGQTGIASRQKVAYVEQKSQIDVTFPMTVRECVSLGFYPKLGLFKGLSQADWAQVDSVLDKVGLLDLAKRPISALSGGQFQRMLLARCLVQDAQVILLDEPFVGVDTVSETIIVNLLKELALAGKLVLVVHHDLTKVRAYFDQLIILNKKLLAHGPTETTHTVSNLKAAFGDLFFTEEEVAHA